MHWYLLRIPSLDAPLYEKWYSLLSPQKKHKVDSFHFEEDKQRLVFADMLAKLALAEYTGCQAEQVHFAVSPNGKPYATALPAEFNVSHSGELVVCAVDSGSVGIDVEKIRPIPAKLVYRVCSDAECAYVLGNAPADAQNMLTDRLILERFYQIWTAKEAYTKYTGTGIATDLRQISVRDKQIQTAVYGQYVISICCDHFRANQDFPCSERIWTFFREIMI